MNITPFKCPQILPYTINDSLAYLRPISPYRLAEAEQAARNRCSDEKYYVLEKAIQILTEAGGFEDGELLLCSQNEILDAYEAWAKLQHESWPDCEALREYISYAIWVDEDVMFDGLAIYHSSGPSDYYGAPVCELTAGQLMYYLILKSEHTKKVESDMKVTKTWLEKMRKKYMASGSGRQ